MIFYLHFCSLWNKCKQLQNSFKEIAIVFFFDLISRRRLSTWFVEGFSEIIVVIWSFWLERGWPLWVCVCVCVMETRLSPIWSRLKTASDWEKFFFPSILCHYFYSFLAPFIRLVMRDSSTQCVCVCVFYYSCDDHNLMCHTHRWIKILYFWFTFTSNRFFVPWVNILFVILTLPTTTIKPNWNKTH